MCPQSLLVLCPCGASVAAAPDGDGYQLAQHDRPAGYRCRFSRTPASAEAIRAAKRDQALRTEARKLREMYDVDGSRGS